jgi:TPR repeat protein
LVDIIPEKIAFEAYRDGKYNDALPTLSALADKGDVEALLALGWIYEAGAAGTQNLELAKLCYQRAADSGSCDALYRLGRILRKSNDLRGALGAFERGAKQEYLPCISALGLLMIRTAVNPNQTRDGMRWLTDAATRGHFFARKEILMLEFENESSFIKQIKILVKVICLGIRYKVERRKNKYSVKVL